MCVHWRNHKQCLNNIPGNQVVVEVGWGAWVGCTYEACRRVAQEYGLEDEGAGGRVRQPIAVNCCHTWDERPLAESHRRQEGSGEEHAPAALEGERQAAEARGRAQEAQQQQPLRAVLLCQRARRDLREDVAGVEG